jgi:hypothetical protein
MPYYLLTVFLLFLGISVAFPASSQNAARNLSFAQIESEPGARRILRVGPDKAFLLPSAAAKAANDGDIIEIDAGIYEKDAAVWRQHNVTIRGIGGKAHIRSGGVTAEGKALWVIKGNNTVIEHIEFSDAKVIYRNGAGIRHEGAGLLIRHCYFHDNENGILTGVSPDNDIVVEHSEFARNGHGDGYSHNLYIGAARSFTLRFSYIHHAVVGHNVKSRAAANYVLYNRIMDEDDGRASYAIDLPNGGLSFIIGNLLQHGQRAENQTLISYGAEGLTHRINKLHLINNTLVNDRPSGRFVFVADGTQTALAANNIFAGPGIPASGPMTLQQNLVAEKSELLDSANFDYRLKPGSRAIGSGSDPGESDGFSLRPQAEYLHPMQSKPRATRTKPDIGAHAY